MKHFASISLVLIAGVALGFSALFSVAHAQFFGGFSGQLTMTPTYTTVPVGQHTQFNVVANTTNNLGQPTPQNVTYNATLVSSDETVATYMGNGSFRANMTGRVTITATYNGMTARATLIVVGQAPVISTQNATNVSPAGATLNTSVTPNGGATEVWFEYGKTQALGQVTGRRSVGAQVFAVNASQPISGLEGNTTYFYRAVAQNAYATVPGNVISFQTSAGLAPSGPAGQSTGLGTSQDFLARLFGMSTSTTSSTAGGAPLELTTASDVNGQIVTFGTPTTYPLPGQTVNYNVAFRNVSDQELSAVMLNVAVPAEVEITGIRPAPATLGPNGFSVNIGKLSPGNGGTVNVTLRVKEAVAPGATLILAGTATYALSGQMPQAVALNTNLQVGDANAPAQKRSFLAMVYGVFTHPSQMLWIILVLAGLLVLTLGYRYIQRRRLAAKNRKAALAYAAAVPKTTPGGVYGQPQRPVIPRQSVPPFKPQLEIKTETMEKEENERPA